MLWATRAMSRGWSRRWLAWVSKPPTDTMKTWRRMPRPVPAAIICATMRNCLASPSWSRRRLPPEGSVTAVVGSAGTAAWVSAVLSRAVVSSERCVRRA